MSACTTGTDLPVPEALFLANGLHLAPAPTSLAGRVLVTGAAGFIASHLVDTLLARGHEVIAVDRRATSEDRAAASNLADAMDHPRLSLRTAELSAGDLDELVAGCDVVFHLAAVPGVRSSWGHRFGEYVASNIIATHRLLMACETAGIRRLVFASSSSVYGPTVGPSQETDPTHPIAPYGVSKLAAEQLCLAHAKCHDTSLTVTALRYFTVYGPRQRPDMAIGRILSAALTGTPVNLYGDGSQRREFTYVSDIVEATIAAASAEARAAVINVGGGSSVPMTEVLNIAEEVIGRPVPVVWGNPQAGDVPATSADLNLARLLLDYQPAVDLADGMARQAAWLAGLSRDEHQNYLTAKLEVSQ